MERIRPKKKIQVPQDPFLEGIQNRGGSVTGRVTSDKLTHISVVEEDRADSPDTRIRPTPKDRPPTDFNPYGDPVHVQIKPQGVNVLTYRERAYPDSTATRAYYAGTLLVGIATLSPTMITFKYHHLTCGDMVDRYETEAALHKALRLMVQDAE